MRIEPPFMRPVIRALPRSLNSKPHHTTSDWQFGALGWTLDTSIYVSAPSSVKFTVLYNLAVLKHSISGAIPEGRIIDYVRWYRGRGAGYEPTYVFRNQAADGAGLSVNYYSLALRGSVAGADADIDQAELGVVLGGAYAAIQNQNISPTLAQQTFHRLRVSWWISSGVLMVRLEYWTGSAWATLCPDFVDINNRWATSAINRCGVGTVRTNTVAYTWHDDTEIYKRV